MGASLADLGLEALSLFQRVQTLDSDKTSQDWPAASFTAEAERFELWAVNLGLFVAGHGSLDYRVREADRLAQTIRRFLQELMDSLVEVVQMRTGDGDEQSPDNNDDGGDDDDAEAEELDSEPSGDSGTEESDLDLLLDGVRDPIDRLYKVSTKIRNPSSRLGSSRAANYQQIDEETGVDFLRAVEQADHDHIRSLFLQYQKARALQECDTVEPTKNLVGGEDDGVWEPIRTVLAQHGAADSFLIRRIARANVRRRQHFAYRKMHREKLARHARASISTQSGLTSGTEIPSHPSFDRHISNDSLIPQAELAPPAASVTTATNLNLARLELIENQSMVTVSEYAPSTWQPARDAVAFPPPPTRQLGDKFFECPYCFTLCPRGALAAKAWKAHLIHDLSPYICTYEDCRNPDQLYDNRHDWGHHENSCHRKVWRCPEHSGQEFTQLEAYRDHLRNEHIDYVDDASANWIIRASESTMTATDRSCPVCSIVLGTPRALESHIALHLERFSLFSLPRSVACGDDDEDDVADADSDKANGTIEDSRDEDFEGDLDIKSENVGDEVEEGWEASEVPESIIEVAEEPTDRPSKIASDEVSRVPEVKNELTEEAVLAINSQVDMADEARSAESEDNLLVTVTAVKIFEDHNTPVYTVAFSPDDKLLASVSDDKVVRLWDLESGASLTRLEGHKSGFRSLAWSHDGRTIASGSYDKTTKLWDASTGTCLHTLLGHGGAVSGLSFSSDDRLLASTSHDKTCKLWEVSTGTVRFTLKGHTAGVWSIGISPNDKYIASGSNDRTVKIWDLTTGALHHTLKGHGRVIYALAFMPDSQILATGGNDWTIKLWDLGSGKLLRSINSHEKGVTALAFSPDGSLMVSGSYDHMIKIWETRTWTNVGILEGHSADVYGVAFSRGGRRIASGSRDRTVRLWDLSLGRQALPVDQLDQAAQSLMM